MFSPTVSRMHVGDIHACSIIIGKKLVHYQHATTHATYYLEKSQAESVEKVDKDVCCLTNRIVENKSEGTEKSY